MSSARSLIDHSPTKPPRVFKRSGAMTKVEKDFVAQFVQDQPTEITRSQVTSLAKTMRRSKEAVQELISGVQEKLLTRLDRYADIHFEATEEALALGTDKSLSIATKASEWAISNIGRGGVRAIDKVATPQAQGTQIIIGVKIGGLNDASAGQREIKVLAKKEPLEIVEGETLVEGLPSTTPH